MEVKRILVVLYLCICTGNALVTDSNFSVYSDPNSTISSTLLPSTTIITTEMSTNETFTTEMPMSSTSSLTIPTISPTPFIPISSTLSPNPPNPVSNWVVVDEETNVTCIVVKFAASFVVPFHTIFGQIQNATLDLPGNATTSSGTCNLGVIEDSHSQKISLQWIAGKSDSSNTNLPNILTFVFHKNMSSGIEATGKELVYLSDIIFEVYLDSENFPNASRVGNYSHGELVNSNLHSVAINNSYRCNSEETFELNLDEKIGDSAIIHISHLQTEAFRMQTDNKFNLAIDCPADKVITSDIVPIAVGCALAALVIVVLVAYLIGRRRARQRGYQSV